MIEETTLSGAPSEVIGLTRPGTTSAMKWWVSEAKRGGSDGPCWLAWEGRKLVGWAAVFEGELSVYVRSSERRRGIGSLLVDAIGDTDGLVAGPHNRIGERFFERHGITTW